MKLSLYLAFLAAALPAFAQAEIIYHCQATSSSELKANLRFSEDGQSGHISVEYWNGLPPFIAISSNLLPPMENENQLEFTSEIDRAWGGRATVRVHRSFLEQSVFAALITQTRSSGAILTNEFSCSRTRP